MKRRVQVAAIGLAALVTGIASVEAVEIQIDFTNNAPTGGIYLTPAWVGFHDGTFDVFSAGASASAALEAISEDGNTGPLFAAFAGAGVDTMVGGKPVAPGQTVSASLTVADDGSNNYFSFASMLLPTSDFFIGNDNPLTTSIAGLLDGTFTRISVDVISVFDAGTEVNDFATSAGNPLFGLPGGQSGPNIGADESAFVVLITSAAYGGFLNIGGADLSGFDFSNYASVATFTLTALPTAVPLPAGLPLLLSALGGLGLLGRHRAIAA